jgi:hypothetical protein
MQDDKRKLAEVFDGELATWLESWGYRMDSQKRVLLTKRVRVPREVAVPPLSMRALRGLVPGDRKTIAELREWMESDFTPDMTGALAQAIQPQEWLRVARSLVVAAERSQIARSRDEHVSADDLSGVYCMLAGFAVENVIKGWSHECDVRHITTLDAGELQDDMRTHNVKSLVERTLLALEDGDARLLEALGETVIWRGRYPCPTNADALGSLTNRPLVVEVRRLLRRLFSHIGKPDNLLASEFERGVTGLIDVIG